MTPQERLIVFARTPKPGKVKTQLCPPLSPEQALQLHCASIADTLERLLKVSRSGLEYWLCLSEALEHPEELEIPSKYEIRIQTEEDLGGCLETAFRQAFDDGAERVVALGSDSPTLPLSSIYEAFQELSWQDVVIGPVPDGSYHILGSSSFVPELFHHVSWASRMVLQQTAKALKRSGKGFSLLVEWYDIHTDADLVRLSEEILFMKRQEPSQVPLRVAAALPPNLIS